MVQIFGKIVFRGTVASYNRPKRSIFFMNFSRAIQLTRVSARGQDELKGTIIYERFYVLVQVITQFILLFEDRMIQHQVSWRVRYYLEFGLVRNNFFHFIEIIGGVKNSYAVTFIKGSDLDRFIFSQRGYDFSLVLVGSRFREIREPTKVIITGETDLRQLRLGDLVSQREDESFYLGR